MSEKREKSNLTRSVFSSNNDLMSTFSDVFILIETTVDNYKQSGFLNDLMDAHRLSRLWIKKLFQNRWLIIYGNSKPHLKQRLRTLKVFQILNMLTVLRSEILHFLNVEKESKLKFSEKINLFEYILATLNTEFYSSKESPTYYFVKNYQRTIFNELLILLKKKDMFREVEKKLLSSFKRWDSYLQASFYMRSNIAINYFKPKIPFKINEKDTPDLPKKENLMIDFLISLHKEEEPSEIAHQSFLVNKRVVGYSLNKIIEKYSSWIKERDYIDTKNKIKIRELRGDDRPKGGEGYIPEVLKSLRDKGLIIITEVKKTRTKRLYSLNIDHPFIQMKIKEN